MPEEQGTLNESGESSQPEAEQSGDLVSTVDTKIPVETPPEEAQTTETETDEDESEDQTEEETTEAEPEKEPPFHEHPRFKELIAEKNALKEQLAQLAEKQTATPKAEQPTNADYEDIGAMTAEQVQDKLDEDPVGFLANFAKQVRSEVRSEILGQIEQREQERFQQTQEQAIAREYEAYAKDNPDFEKMWDSGDIEKYMQDHPGHNAISAHMVLTREAREAELLKKAEQKIQKNLKAKRSAQVLSSGPSSSGRSVGKAPPELLDTKKYGGLAAVLAQRSAQRLPAA